MDVFLVRQPIFDRQQNVFAYEILRRSHPPDSVEYSMMEPAATGTIGDAVLLAELNRITRGRRAFIQCSANSIIAGPELHLPAPMMVIEVLEEVQPDALFIEYCKRLKDAGYQLTLGDFALKLENMHPILDLVDFIRIDFQELNTTEMKTNINRAVSGEIKLLANGVETREDFKLALDAGCAYFQGDFFNQAVIIPSKDIPSYKLNHLRILYELARDDLDFVALETVIKRDVSLSYKLLNCVNSVFFGMRPTVSSIHHALTLLGEHEIRKWASLVTLTNLGQDQPAELLVTSLLRANFCALLAPLAGLGNKTSELFLVGLFSLLDTIVGRPMKEIMQHMPLRDDIKTALEGGRNKYRGILDLVLSYEMGDLGGIMVQAFRSHLDEGLITDSYLHAIDLTEETMQLYGSRSTNLRHQR